MPARLSWCCASCKPRPQQAWRRSIWASSHLTAPRCVLSGWPARSAGGACIARFRGQHCNACKSLPWLAVCTCSSTLPQSAMPPTPTHTLQCSCPPPRSPRQVALLDRMSRGARLDGVEALTVDKCQGRDKDCIVLSLVKSNAEGDAGERRWSGMQAALVAAQGLRLASFTMPQQVWTSSSARHLTPCLTPAPYPPVAFLCLLTSCRQAAAGLAAHQRGHHARQAQAAAAGRRRHAALHPTVCPTGRAGARARLVHAAAARCAGRAGLTRRRLFASQAHRVPRYWQAHGLKHAIVCSLA